MRMPTTKYYFLAMGFVALAMSLPAQAQVAGSDHLSTSGGLLDIVPIHHASLMLAYKGEHILIDADHYTPVDSGLIPTGELAPVEGTPFDLRKPTLIGKADPNADPQMKLGGGYDHNWVLNGAKGVMKTAAKAYDPGSGRVLTVTTTEPGVQFYSGNSLPGIYKGHSGHAYPKRSGFCLETQHFPDSPNHPKFPSTLLKPGETMHSQTTFTFTTQGK